MTSQKPSEPAVDENDAFDLSMDIDDMLASFASIIPTESTENANQPRQPVQTTKVTAPLKNAYSDKRIHHRHLVQWRVAIVNKASSNHDIYHGRTNDVSMTGLSILLEHNKSFSSEVTVLIAIPPMQLGMKETIVEAQCMLTHTVLDSVHSQFRLGMKFLHFKGEGKIILSDVLSARPIPKEESYNFTAQRY